jgi:hypothetical protein
MPMTNIDGNYAAKELSLTLWRVTPLELEEILKES